MIYAVTISLVFLPPLEITYNRYFDCCSHAFLRAICEGGRGAATGFVSGDMWHIAGAALAGGKDAVVGSALPLFLFYRVRLLQ